MLTQITLQNFRCFTLNRFGFEKITYICGENGCGKTSILEAVSMLNGQNSFRGNNEELIRNGVGIFEIMGELDCGSVFIKHDGEKKLLEFDEEKVNQNQLKKLICPVIFTPNHELSLSTNSQTRTFFDKLCLALFPNHETLLNKCRDLYSERLKILHLSGNKTWLDSIEEQISQNLTVILFNRLNFIQKLAEFFKEINVTHTVDVQNQYVSMLKNKETFSSIEQKIVGDLFFSREADKAQNRNSISVNDVDYQLTFSGKNSCFASSGQQKLLGSLIAIGTGYFAQKSHNGVIILLDDITAKIDEKNQNFLHSIIEFSNCQTIITTINLLVNNHFNINLP